MQSRSRSRQKLNSGLVAHLLLFADLHTRMMAMNVMKSMNTASSDSNKDVERLRQKRRSLVCMAFRQPQRGRWAEEHTHGVTDSRATATSWKRLCCERVVLADVAKFSKCNAGRNLTQQPPDSGRCIPCIPFNLPRSRFYLKNASPNLAQLSGRCIGFQSPQARPSNGERAFATRVPRGKIRLSRR